MIDILIRLGIAAAGATLAALFALAIAYIFNIGGDYR